jgi:hypothetical protein
MTWTSLHAPYDPPPPTHTIQTCLTAPWSSNGNNEGSPSKMIVINKSLVYIGSMNTVFWDIFTVVSMKDAFLDFVPCGFGGTYHLHLQDNEINFPSSQ